MDLSRGGDQKINMRQKFSIILLLALLCGLTSCGIQKRHYRNGFYFNRPGGNATAQTNTPEAPAELENAAEEKTDVPPQTETATDSDTALAPSPGDTAVVDAERNSGELSYPDRVLQKSSAEHHAAAPPITKDKKQAVGAGIAAAIFFVLGMVGLIIKGTAPPTGVFIIAAFVCFLLCVVLASFLYPRDPVVKQPKEPVGSLDPAAKFGIGFLLVVLFITIAIGGLFFTLFTDLFF